MFLKGFVAGSKRSENWGHLAPFPIFILVFVLVWVLLLFSRSFLVHKHPPIEPWFFGFSGALLGILAFIASHRYLAERVGYRFFDPLPKQRDARIRAVIWLGAGVFGAFTITFLSLLLEWDQVKNILEKHGSLFDWIFGGFTVFGIWFTYSTIVETQRIIRSFTQLTDRIIELAKDTKKQGGDLRFLAYTASIGFLALQKENWDKLNTALYEIRSHLKIICLDDDDLNSWHNQYVGRSTRRQPSEGGDRLTLIDTLAATNGSREVTHFNGVERQERKSEQMPGFYLIFNDRRAIIVSPFFIPPHPLTPESMQPPNTNVQMFGFETTDPRIIEDVRGLFDYYWKGAPDEPHYFDSQIVSLERLQETVQEGFRKWKPETPLSGKCLRYRIWIVEEDPWGRIQSYLNTKVTNREYTTYLHNKTTSRIEHNVLIVEMQNKEGVSWIETNCLEHVKKAKEQLKLPFEIQFKPASSQAAATSSR